MTIICTSTVHHGDTLLTVTGTGPTYPAAFAAAAEATDVGYRPSPPNLEGALRLLRAHEAGGEVPQQSNYAYYDMDVEGEPTIQIGWVDFTFTKRDVRLWAITAQVSVLTGAGWDSSRQVPTFYLDPAVQGITDRDHAARIAEDILFTSAGDAQGVTIAVHVEPVY